MQGGCRIVHPGLAAFYIARYCKGACTTLHAARCIGELATPSCGTAAIAFAWRGRAPHTRCAYDTAGVCWALVSARARHPQALLFSPCVRAFKIVVEIALAPQLVPTISFRDPPSFTACWHDLFVPPQSACSLCNEEAMAALRPCIGVLWVLRRRRGR